MSRKVPYTIQGIKRMKCFRCGKKARYQWQICSDDNTYRPICEDCDIELNKMVLCFMQFPNWEEKLEEYKRRVSHE